MKTKFLFLIFSLFLLDVCAQNNYYVSNEGNDLNDGKSVNSPWASMSKVAEQAKSFRPGDIIAFRGGDIFYGELVINNMHGTIGQPITIESYGVGKAVINGSVPKSNWVNEEGNIWKLTEPNDVFQVFKNNLPIQNARSQKYFVTSKSSSTTFKCNDLIGRTDLVGSTMLLLTSDWFISQSKVIGFNSGSGEVKLDKEPSQAISSNIPFFVINDYNELKKENHWVYKNDNLYINSVGNPKNISVSSGNTNGIKLTSSSFVNITNLHIRHFNNVGIFLANSSNCNIEKNLVEYNYEQGIVNYGDERNINIIQNVVRGVMGTGISNSASFSNIKSNVVHQIGTEELYTYKNATSSSAIGSDGDNSNIELNNVFNVGYNGIVFRGKSMKINNNYITNFCNFLQDGAAIYTHTGSTNGIWNASKVAYSKVENNVIIGSNKLKSRHAFGIYLDDCTTDVDLLNNSISNTATGIYLHNNKRCNLKFNKLYSNKNGIVVREEPNGDNSGGLNDNNGEMKDNRISFNQIYLQENYFEASALSLHSHYGNINLYSGDNNIFYNNGHSHPLSVLMKPIQSGNQQEMTLKEFQDFTGTENKSIQNLEFIQPFSIESYLGENTLDNEDFSNGTAGWSAKNGSLNNSNNILEFRPSSNDGLLVQSANLAKFNLGETYLFEFDGRSSQIHSIGFRFQEMNPPYSNAGIKYSIHLKPTWTSYKFLINPKFSGTDVRLTIHDLTKIGFDIDNISIRKVKEGPKPINSKFAYNETSKPKVISLQSGIWEDFDGQSFNGSITIQPYSSKILKLSTKGIGINAFAGEDQSICKGESVTLTASGGSDYVWNTGATSQSITVSPTSTLIYTVTVSEGNESAKDDVEVRVNEVIADAGSDKTIIAGETITLLASGGDSYQWSTGETTESIMVSPNMTNIYSVTVTSDSCEDTDEVKITVNSGTGGNTFIADAGEDQSICKGESVTLTASGGSDYVWNTGATSQSITVSPTSTSIYTVTVSEGNESAKDDVEVRVNEVIADAGSDKTIIAGETITLLASGGDLYQWSTGETTESIMVSPNMTNIYSVTVTSDSCEDTDEVKITVNSGTGGNTFIADAGEDKTICLGESITLHGSGGDTYLWSTGETSKSIDISPVRTTTILFTSTKDGLSSTDNVTITVENCKKNEDMDDGLTLSEISVYPNPTSGILNINISNSDETHNLIINDHKGSIIYSDILKFSSSPLDSHEIDIRSYVKGVYFLRIINSKEQVVKKVVLL